MYMHRARKYPISGMAFFAFARSAQPEAAPDIDTIRRRARHRLIGAVVLVAAAVLGFPMVFDTDPRPVPVDIPIDIPAREQTTPLTVPAEDHAVPDGVAPPPTAQTPEAVVPPDTAATQVAEVQPAPGSAPTTPPATAALPVAAAPPPQGTAPATQTAQRPKPTAPQPNSAEARRVRAILEGGGTQVASAAPSASASPAKPQRYIVQVGAFTDAAKVRAVRAQLELAGLKSFIQQVQTRDGKQSTRVRLGVFSSRAEAERFAARVKEQGLPADVLKL